MKHLMKIVRGGGRAHRALSFYLTLCLLVQLVPAPSIAYAIEQDGNSFASTQMGVDNSNVEQLNTQESDATGGESPDAANSPQENPPVTEAIPDTNNGGAVSDGSGQGEPVTLFASYTTDAYGEVQVTVDDATEGMNLIVKPVDEGVDIEAELRGAGLDEFSVPFALDIEVTSPYVMTTDVTVTVKADAIKNLSNLATLYHIGKNGTEGKDYEVDRQAGTFTFRSHDFSPFVVVEPAPEPAAKALRLGAAPEEASFTASVTNGLDNVTTDLTEEGASITTKESGLSFKLNVEAAWPANSTKHQIKINAGYGLAWANSTGASFSFDTLDKSEIWYTGLDGAMIKPAQQADAADKPITWADRNFRNGTLTLNYKDSVSRVDIVGSTGGKLALYSYVNGGYSLIGATGLPTINQETVGTDPITVTFSYVDSEGTPHEVVKKLSELNFTDNAISNISVTTTKNHGLVESGHYVVLEGESLKTSDLAWNWSSTGVGYHIVQTEEGYFVIEVPKDAVLGNVQWGSNLSSRITGKFSRTGTLEDGAELPDGTTLELADPENNVGVLFTLTPGARGLTYNYGGVNGMTLSLGFPVDKYPASDTLYTVRVAAAGLKVHYTDDWVSMADNPSAKHGDIKVQIQAPEENTYVCISDTSTGHQGSISSGNVYPTNEGVGVTEETVAGTIYIGNRGTGDSVPKTVTCDFGATNGQYVGITQAPIYNMYKASNLKIWIWKPGDEGSIQEVSLTEEQAASFISASTVHINSLTSDNDYYIKKLTYDIESIPHRKVTGTNLNFYGVEVARPASDVTSRNDITICDKDNPENRKYTGHPNTVARAANSYSPLAVNGGGTYTAGDKVKLTFNLGSVANGAYGPYHAFLADKAYIISPYGEEYENITVSYVGTKSTSGATTTGAQPVITELPESQLETLRQREGFENARVWELDFSEMTENPDKFNRLLGVTTATTSTAREVVYGSQNATIQNKVPIRVTCDVQIAPDHPLGTQGGNNNGLAWLKPLYPVNEDGSDNIAGISFDSKKYNIDNTFQPDTNNLTGMNTRMLSGGYLTIVGASKIIATSTMKAESEPEEEYKPYDGTDESLAEAVLEDVDYRVTLFNSSTQPANEGTIYIPIPKKGEEWNGTVIEMTPNGPFTFDMSLTGPGELTVGEGYTISYASATPAADKEIWATYDWKSADEVDDWSAINFVRITKVGVPAQDRATVQFKLKSDFTEEDIANKEQNVLAPYVISDTAAGTVEETNSAVGARLLPAKVSGVVWWDADMDGLREEGEDPAPGVTVTLYRADGTTELGSAETDENGVYTIEDPVYDAGSILKLTYPDGYTIIVPVANDSKFDPATQSVTLPALDSYESNGWDCGLHVVEYDVSILKVDSYDKTPLEGAVFKLLPAGEEGAYDPEAVPVAENLESNADGIVELGTLEGGIYYLVETQAPENHKPLENPLKLELTRENAKLDGEEGETGETSQVVTFTVENEPTTRPYTVGFYYQKDDGTWSDEPNSTSVREDEVGKTVSVTDDDKIPTLYGPDYSYAFDESNEGNVLEATVLPDGSTVLKVYFKQQIVMEGEKVWDDHWYYDKDGNPVEGYDESGGARPAVTINLLADDEETGKSIVLDGTVDENGEYAVWKYRFEGLDKFKDGALVTYSVTEDEADGYETTITDGEVKNRPVEEDVLEPVSVTVKKVDALTGTGVGIAGAKFTLTPATDPEKETEEFTTDANGELTIVFTKDGTYTLEETEAPQGYELPASTSYTIRVSKEFVKVELKQSIWQWLYNLFAGIDNVPAYVADDDGKGGTLTVADPPSMKTVKANKVWDDDSDRDGLRGDVTIDLYKEIDGAKTKLSDKSTKVTYDASGNPVEIVWSNLPAAEDGKVITYSVDEAEVPQGYEKEIAGSEKDGFTITNKHVPETLDVAVKKVWEDANDQDGCRSDSVEVTLSGKDSAGADASLPAGTTAAQTLNERNGWAFTWQKVYKYQDHGKEITYSVSETEDDVITGEDAPGTYAYEVAGDASSGFTVTNTHTPETVDMPVTVGWVDADDQDGCRPDKVTVRLMDGDTLVEEVEVKASEDGTWKYEFADLPKFRPGSHGEEIAYTLVEVEDETITGTDGPGTYAYAVTGDVSSGFTVTNTHTPELIEVPVTKTWDDGDDINGVRPKSVTVKLLADGLEVGSAAIKPDESGAWVHKFSELPKYRDHGTEIAYTVAEDPVPGYEATVSGSAAEGYAITNTHKVDVITVDPPVKKTVKGEGAPAGAKFTFTLKANPGASKLPEGMTEMPMPAGSTGQAKSVTVTGGGEYEFGTFEIRQQGTYVYTMTEEAVGEAGWTYDGSTYTVTYTVGAEGGHLKATTVIAKDGKAYASKAPEFVNTYTKKATPGKPTGGRTLAKTGDPLNQTLLLGLLFGGAAAVALGIRRRRRAQ